MMTERIMVYLVDLAELWEMQLVGLSKAKIQRSDWLSLAALPN